MLNELKGELNLTTTENGATVLSSTLNDVLDFYSVGGSLRNRTETEIVSLFRNAYLENPLLAMKTLFYLRDARLGQGERRTFRTILRHLGDVESATVSKNIHLVAEYGRYDDLYALVGTKSEKALVELFKTQFNADMESEFPSLLGKWMKSENASSEESKRLGRWTSKNLGLTPRQYRKALKSLRDKLNIVETAMSKGDWSEIDYSKIPSKALLQYRVAFNKHDELRFTAFNEAVATGEAKINANVMPYELVRKVLGDYTYVHDLSDSDIALLNNMWANLPDFTGEVGENAIAVVDVSGSMTWEQNALALHSALGLGMYMAERSKGAYHDHFLTFSDRPEMVKLRGNGFVERVSNMTRANVGGSTNLEATLDLILNTAVKHNLSQDEMVDKLYIITDMEFNCVGTNDAPSSYYHSKGFDKLTFMQSMKKKFAEKGYELPTVVFINVNARNSHYPVQKDESGIYMVSGMSATIFKAVLNNSTLSAYDMMLEVLNGERYAPITV